MKHGDYDNRRHFDMLKRFETENFKAFKERIVFDLTARDYEFNKPLVKNGIVNKAIVYGKNGVGKSCLGIAIFDIVAHLTDKQKMNATYLQNYRNLEADSETAKFKYCFDFEGDIVEYEYEKYDIEDLYSEKLTINGEVKINYCYFDASNNYIDKNLVGELNIDLHDNKLSVLKYIYKNTPTNSSPIITRMINFCENMLWYRRLSDGNSYSGYTSGRSTLVQMLYENNALDDFNNFLKENDVYYDLELIVQNGKPELYALFNNGQNRVTFESVASTGTMALYLFYIWSMYFNKISFLFIDEFDAFFHYESAENIVLKLNKAVNFQTVLTSHNTYLMQNKLTRPDCCFIMTKKHITNLYDATDKEIREAHNLEKMYINGVFKE